MRALHHYYYYYIVIIILYYYYYYYYLAIISRYVFHVVKNRKCGAMFGNFLPKEITCRSSGATGARKVEPSMFGQRARCYDHEINKPHEYIGYQTNTAYTPLKTLKRRC